LPEKAFVYIRVSSKDQADKMTYKTQESVIREYLPTVDVEVVPKDGKSKYFSDLGISGAAKERPDFDEMMSRLGEVTAIVAYDMSRLTRDWEQAIKLSFELKRLSIKIYLAKERRIMDPKDAYDMLINIIMGWGAEQERERITKNRIMGIQRYVAEGGKLGRPEKEIDWKKYDHYKSLGIPKVRICKMLEITPKTLYKRLKERAKKAEKVEKVGHPSP
jgi:DNA invertase Pin-like site-specific DNA recombinase